ncbi:MAG: fibronectin type III domain-containing protein [Candidatus Peregrinibacteria bacterium]
MKKILSTGCALLLFFGIAISPFQNTPVSEAADAAPAKVEGLAVLPDDAKAVLLWDSLSLPDGSKVKDYTVFWGTKSVKEGLAKEYEHTKTVTGATIDEAGIVKYTVPELQNGTKYFFAVKPVSDKITATYSTEVLGTPSQDTSTLPPYVKDAEVLTKNLVKLTMSKKVVLPTEAPAMSFTITEKADEKKILEVKNVSFKTNYFLIKNAKDPKNPPKDGLVTAEDILYIETADQEKDKDYILTVSATIKDEATHPVSSGATDSDVFKGTDAKEIPATETAITATPSASATPSAAATATKTPDETKAVAIGKTSEALEFLAGKVKVSFSENSAAGVLSVGAEKDILVKALTADTSKKFLESGYHISFGDQVKRTLAAKIIVSYTDEELKARTIDEKKLVLFTSEDGVKWEEKAGVVDETKNTITVDTTHFSYWVVGESQGALHGAAPDKTPPENVTELVATFKAQVSDFLVTLTWKNSLNKAGDLASQLLYVSTDKGVTWSPSSDLGKDEHTATFTGRPDTEYTFKVTTKDTAGNESTGAIASVRLPALPTTGAPIFIALGMAFMGSGFMSLRRKK